MTPMKAPAPTPAATPASDTPRTDAFGCQPCKGDIAEEWADFARQLERDLAAANEALEVASNKAWAEGGRANELWQQLTAARGRIAELEGLLGAALPYIPAGAFYGDIGSRPLDEVRLINQVSAILTPSTGGPR